MIAPALVTRLNLETGVIDGGRMACRHLSELRGVFADPHAFESELRKGDPVVYSVSSVELAQGDGQLHYGLGRLLPGKVGREYFLTKGHYHAWRCAAEVYIGLRGSGVMLMQDAQKSYWAPLETGGIVYVPGDTAHRTINTGLEPLVYLGVYPAAAGHDYASIAERNFQCVVIEHHGGPCFVKRTEFT